MRSFQGCWLSIVLLAFIGCAHKTVSDLVVSADPGTVVHRTRQTSVMDSGDDSGDPKVVVQTEKAEVKLGDGTVGFFVRFPDGQRVFLTREPFVYGEFDVALNVLKAGVPTFAIPNQLKGIWRLVTAEESMLLIEVCKLFEHSSEVPYACIFGAWAMVEQPEYTLPVIRPTGEVEKQRCDDEAGLMFVEENETEGESVSK